MVDRQALQRISCTVLFWNHLQKSFLSVSGAEDNGPVLEVRQPYNDQKTHLTGICPLSYLAHNNFILPFITLRNCDFNIKSIAIEGRHSSDHNIVTKTTLKCLHLCVQLYLGRLPNLKGGWRVQKLVLDPQISNIMYFGFLALVCIQHTHMHHQTDVCLQIFHGIHTMYAYVLLGYT